MQIEQQLKELNQAFAAFKEQNTKELGELKAKGTVDPLIKEHAEKAFAATQELQKTVDELTKAMNRERETNNVLGMDAKEKTDKYLKHIMPAVIGEQKTNETAHSFELKAMFFDGNNRWDEKKELEYRKAFVKHMRTGDVGVIAEYLKSINVINDAAGGFLINPVMMDLITHTIAEFSPFHQEVDVINVLANELSWPATNRRVGAVRKHELGAVSESTAPTFKEFSVKPEELYSQPFISQRMLQLRPDIEQMVAQIIADEFLITEASEMAINTTPGGCRGMTTFANGTTPGFIEQVAGGHASQITSLSPFIDIIAKLKEAYLPNAKFHAKRVSWASVSKIVDGQGRYMWQPSVQLGKPATFFGYPALNSEDMPAIAADSISFLFGDLKKAYKLVVWPGMRILRDPYTNKPYVQMHTTRTSGGDVVLHEALKALKTAESL